VDIIDDYLLKRIEKIAECDSCVYYHLSKFNKDNDDNVNILMLHIIEDLTHRVSHLTKTRNRLAYNYARLKNKRGK